MSKIFFGYILVFFHIKLNGFDILMDCVGFFLIWQGLCAYEDAPSFQRAKPWALALGAISILDVFGGLVRIFTFAPLSAFANLLTLGMSLYLLWLIGCGMGELEAVHELPLGAGELKRLWKVQAGANIVATLLAYVPTTLTALLATIALFAGVAANVLFLVHIYKAKKTLDEGGLQ